MESSARSRPERITVPAGKDALLPRLLLLLPMSRMPAMGSNPLAASSSTMSRPVRPEAPATRTRRRCLTSGSSDEAVQSSGEKELAYSNAAAELATARREQ